MLCCDVIHQHPHCCQCPVVDILPMLLWTHIVINYGFSLFNISCFHLTPPFTTHLIKNSIHFSSSSSCWLVLGPFNLMFAAFCGKECWILLYYNPPSPPFSFSCWIKLFFSSLTSFLLWVCMWTFHWKWAIINWKHVELGRWIAIVNNRRHVCVFFVRVSEINGLNCVKCTFCKPRRINDGKKWIAPHRHTQI